MPSTVRLVTHRLDGQLLARRRASSPPQVVAWFGAMQAQDYLAALWAVGLRTLRTTEAAIEAALTEGRVLRTHLFRGTWQYVARDDVRWMLDLMGPRVIASWAPGFRRQELADRTLKRCGALLGEALAGGRRLTRPELTAVLERGRIPAVSPRLSSILGHAELSAGRRDKQPTWGLLDDRAPPGPRVSPDHALAELAVRYFQSRGPATVSDFAWWTGLSLGRARQALALVESRLVSRPMDGATCWLVDRQTAARGPGGAHLLPAFDEYLVGYRDRSAVLDPAHAGKVNAGGGMLSPAVVIDGRVVGTWRRTLGQGRVTIAVRRFGRLARTDREAVAAAAERYAAFVGLNPRIVI
jgi:hypothetical protein